MFFAPMPWYVAWAIPVFADGLVLANSAHNLCISVLGSKCGACNGSSRAADGACNVDVLEIPFVGTLVVGRGGVAAHQCVSKWWHRPPHWGTPHEERFPQYLKVASTE